MLSIGIHAALPCDGITAVIVVVVCDELFQYYGISLFMYASHHKTSGVYVLHFFWKLRLTTLINITKFAINYVAIERPQRPATTSFIDLPVSWNQVVHYLLVGQCAARP